MDTYHDARLAERIAAQLAAHDLADGPLAPEQLYGLDQFHVGGPEPVRRLLGHAEPVNGARGLDLGSGFGGTSRLVAKAAGLAVTVRDDRTESAAAWAARIGEPGPPPGPALPAVLERGMERIGNLARAIGAGQLTLIEGMAHV